MLKSEGEERITDQDGNVLAENLVVPSEIVVVYGVNHLDGASGGHRHRFLTFDDLTGEDAEHGSYSFVSGKEQVPHRFVNLLQVLEQNAAV